MRAQWVAGAVEANSLHVLRHLGITHVLNATEDLLMPDPDAGFRCTPWRITPCSTAHRKSGDSRCRPCSGGAGADGPPALWSREMSHDFKAVMPTAVQSRGGTCARRCMRCPVCDMEEEDIGRYFDAARAFIDGAAAVGGAVLVHCHEGKSRSVTLVLAYFMQTQVPSLGTLQHYHPPEGCCAAWHWSYPGSAKYLSYVAFARIGR